MNQYYCALFCAIMASSACRKILMYTYYFDEGYISLEVTDLLKNMLKLGNGTRQVGICSKVLKHLRLQEQKIYQKNEIKMSFSDIERILGFRLSNFAYLYPAQWSISESQSFAFGWLNAGYLTQHVNFQEQTVEFIKVARQSHQIQKTSKETVRGSRERRATLELDEAVRCIRTYFNETVKDSHGRYLSWRHCYNAFMENRNNADEKILDFLMLDFFKKGSIERWLERLKEIDNEDG